MASGINSTFRQVGIATGIAGLGAVFQHSVTQHSRAALAASGHAAQVAGGGTRTARGAAAVRRDRAASAGRFRRPRGRRSSNAYHVGFTDGLSQILVIAGAIALVGSVFAFALVRSRDFVATGEHAPATEAETAGALAS